MSLVILTCQRSGDAVCKARRWWRRLSVLGSLLYALLLGGSGEVLAQSTCTTSSPAITEYKTAEALADDVDLTGLATDCTTLLGLSGTQGFDRLPLDWNTNTNIGTWTGVDVEGTPPRVTWLNLSVVDQLGGTIPATLSNLTHLEVLDLQGNDLAGVIPDLSDLTQLRPLYLGGNNLTGLIPTTLSDLTHLAYLSLNNNDLAGVIPDLSDLTQLRSLHLYNNDLTSPLPDLSGLTRLRSLDLRNNDLTDPLSAFSDLTQLRYLYLSGTAVTGSLLALSDLTHLEVLNLSGTTVTSPLSALSDLTQLWSLNLSGTTVTDPLSALSDLTQLRSLNLSGTAVTDPLSALSDLTQLRYLYLSGTAVTGSLSALSDLTQLRSLHLSGTSVTGPIPDLSTLTSMWELDLNFTALKGDLPAGLRAEEPDTLLWTIDSPLSGDCKLRRVWTSTQDTDASAALQAWPTQSSPAGSLFDLTVVDAQDDPSPTCEAQNTPIQVRLPIPTDMTASQAALYRYNEDAVPPVWERQVAGAGRQLDGEAYEYEVHADITQFSLFRVGHYTPPPDDSGSGDGDGDGDDRDDGDGGDGDGDGGDGDGDGGGSGGGSGGNDGGSGGDDGGSGGNDGGSGGDGGGGGGCARDAHSNIAARATAVALDSPTAGVICPASDRDYFRVSVPGPGFLSVATSGQARTWGVIRQHGARLAAGSTSDGGLDAQVEAGPVVVLIRGDRGGTGAYRVTVRFTPEDATDGLTGVFENPGHDSFQSGVGVISGWVCEADEVWIQMGDFEPQPAAYGTERLDTLEVCGDTDNGFGLLFNWTLLGDGPHEVVAFVDGEEWARATVQVTTLGEEVLRDAEGSCEVADFPSPGEEVTVIWQESLQNFVIADGEAPAGPNRAGSIDTGFLENPGPDSFQSGVGVISGWVCEADEVWIQMGDFEPQPAAYGTERLDTLEVCGDTDNGFGLLFNWTLLGDGTHEVVAFVDGEEWARATVQVTTLGEEVLRDAEGSCEVADFPEAGETVTLIWQQRLQNFVIADREGETPPRR